MDIEKNIKRKGRVFSGQNGGKYGKRPVMPLLKYNSISYPRNDNPLLSIALSTRPSLPLRLPLCFSFYSLNNRTAASGRRRGVTSKRLFRKMQMRVPFTRPRTMRHPSAPPPTVIKRAHEDNLRTEEVDALHSSPVLRAPSLMRTRTVLRLSTLIRYFNRKEEERGRTFRVVTRQTFRRKMRRWETIIEQNLTHSVSIKLSSN